jgi:hypothetical protein
LTIAHWPKLTSNQATFLEIYNKMKLIINIFDFTSTLYWFLEHVNIAENKSVD